MYVLCQVMIPYNFLITAKTWKGNNWQSLQMVFLQQNFLNLQRCRQGLRIWGVKYCMWTLHVQPTMQFVLHARGFSQSQYHKLKLLATFSAFPLQRFPLDVELFAYICVSLWLSLWENNTLLYYLLYCPCCGNCHCNKRSQQLERKCAVVSSSYDNFYECKLSVALYKVFSVERWEWLQ